MEQLFPALIFVLLGSINADYQCVCNYDLSAKVYDAVTSGNVVDTMNEFDCKPLKMKVSGSSWASIVLSDHSTAFVQTGGMVLVQTCPGDPPTAATTTPTSPPTTRKTTTPTPTTTTPTPTPAPIDGQWSHWSQYGPCSKSCGTGTSTRQRTCSNPTPSHGGRHCEGVDKTSKSCNSEVCPGNIALCPAFLKQQSAHDQNPIGQYRDSCYEFLHHEAVPHIVADSHCTYRRGFIVDIQSAGEQAYIEHFIRSLNSNAPFWTGLFDFYREGQFEWTSGSAVGYNNWLPGRPNHAFPNRDDCVQMSVSPSTFGKWNDVACDLRLNVICEFSRNALLN